MRKLFDNIKAVYSLDAETYTDVTAGAHVVDTQGYGDGMLIAVAGDITDTTGDSYTIKVMECDTSDGTFTASGISVVFTGGASQDNTLKVARIAELGVARKRFLRADLVCTATTTSWEGAAVILLGESVNGAVNDD
jgi:hypothetical protein